MERARPRLGTWIVTDEDEDGAAASSQHNIYMGETSRFASDAYTDKLIVYFQKLLVIS